MATYVNDLRLKEIATGDESGTWGTSTNTNLELIGEALGFGTEAITTNADTHTTTVADGSTDPGRAMYIKYTGTLDSACTITIAPNTMSRMHFIENGTSGSQNIIISQGTGANVTIPAGDVKAVYLDGAGSGAAVTDAFASLNVVDLKVEDDLTVTDDATIGGILDITDTTDASDATGDTGALRTEGGASIAKKLFVGTDLDVDGTTNLDAVDIDGAVQIDNTVTVGVDDTGYDVKLFGATASAFLLWDASTDDLVLSGAAGLSVNGPTTATGEFKANGGVVFNEDSADVDFRVESNSNTHMLHVDAGNDKVGINTSAGDGLLHVQSASAGSVTADATADELVLENSSNTGMSLLMPSDGLCSILFGNPGTDGQKDGGIRYYGETHSTTANRRSIEFTAGGTAKMSVFGTFVDIGGTKSAHANADDLIVGSYSTDGGITINAQNNENSSIFFGDNDSVLVGQLEYVHTGDIMTFIAGLTEFMRIVDGDALVIKNTTVVNSAFLTVQSNDNGGVLVGQTGTNAYRHRTHEVSTGIHKFASSNNTATLSNAGAWTNASDISYKENIEDISYGLNTIKALQPRKYTVTCDGSTDIGFIAQEMEKVVPEVVIGKEGEKGITYGNLTAVLVKGIQELEARVATLEG
mgnify:CR=1 FL=1|jgi:hypothetical protein